jgi:hypothetical protein
LNPRNSRLFNGFRIRPVRPLRHLSSGAHHNSLRGADESLLVNFLLLSIAWQKKLGITAD